MVFTESEIDYLRTQRLGRLATLKPDGTPQNSPVTFGYHEPTRTIDIGGHRMAASRKFRNVGVDDRVAFVVDDVLSVDPWQVRCLEIRGRAEAIAEPGEHASPIAGPIIRIRPTRIISYGIGEAWARDVG